MNESTVSSAFMSQLRVALPGALIFKHRDASFIGLPDCSVTYNQRVLWLEFKFYPLKKKWILNYDPGFQRSKMTEECMIEATKKAPVQRELMNRLAAQAPTFYVIWFKKTCIAFVNPLTLEMTFMDTTAKAVAEVAAMLKGQVSLF